MRPSNKIDNVRSQMATEKLAISRGQRCRVFAFTVFAVVGLVGNVIVGNVGLAVILAALLLNAVIATLKTGPHGFRLIRSLKLSRWFRCEVRQSRETSHVNQSALSIAEQDRRVTEFVKLMEERNRLSTRQLH